MGAMRVAVAALAVGAALLGPAVERAASCGVDGWTAEHYMRVTITCEGKRHWIVLLWR